MKIDSYFVERRSLTIICSFRHVYENNLQMAASTLSLINLLVATVRYSLARPPSRCFKMSSFSDSACYLHLIILLRSCLEALGRASVSRDGICRLLRFYGTIVCTEVLVFVFVFNRRYWMSSLPCQVYDKQLRLFQSHFSVLDRAHLDPYFAH